MYYVHNINNDIGIIFYKITINNKILLFKCIIINIIDWNDYVLVF